MLWMAQQREKLGHTTHLVVVAQVHKKRGSNGWPSIIMNTVIQAQDKKAPLMTMTGPRLAHLNMGPETNCFGAEERFTHRQVIMTVDSSVL